MKKWISVITLLLLAAFALIGTWRLIFPYSKMKIKDVSQAENLTLFAKNKNVSGLEVYVEGYLDDTAKINWTLLGKGKVNALIQTGDHYADTFAVNYLPLKAKSGHLTLRYRFDTGLDLSYPQ